MDFSPSKIKRIPSVTAVAGTAITFIIGVVISLYERAGIHRLNILEAATAHTLTIMRALSKGAALAAAAAGQAVLHIANDLGLASPLAAALAAGDYIAYKSIAGKWRYGVVASVSGSAGDFTVTLAANIEDGIALGADILYFAAPGDGHEQRLLTASVENELKGEPAYYFADSFGQPLICHINNATNAAIVRGGVEVALTV